jgi:hypothetical protein
MTENVSTNSRTKHVDVRYHFVREFVEEGFVKIIFVRSEHNTSDGFTKNVTGDIYDAHVADYMEEGEIVHHKQLRSLRHPLTGRVLESVRTTDDRQTGTRE